MMYMMQGGNNNTYCHDSELNWFNWEQASQDETGYARFFRCLVNLRSAPCVQSPPALQFAMQPTMAHTSFAHFNTNVQTHGGHSTYAVSPHHLLPYIWCSCGSASNDHISLR